MLPAIVSHTTPKADRPRPTVECSEKEDKARQEFKKDADVAYLIKKYGGNLPLGNARFGVQEFGVDRLTALERLDAAQAAFDALPEAVRKQYGSWEGAFSAFVAGEFTSEAPSSPSGGDTATDGASDSAAGRGA